MKIDFLGPRGFLRRYLMVAAFCCVIAVLTTATWPQTTYLSQLGQSLCIGTCSWAIIECGRRLIGTKDDHGSWPRGWRGIALVAVGLGGGFYLGGWLGHHLFSDGFISSQRDIRVSLVITLTGGTAISYFFYSRGKANALNAMITAAERDASEAKLRLLETQLEPHMLFNTLANLRVLITIDPPRAVAMLDRLNSYLRVTLSGSRALSHPLSAEFDRLRDYLELMSVRMGERLHYTLELPDDLRDVPVPPLLLQPLIENSIQHGLEPKVEGGSITVRASRRNGSSGSKNMINMLVIEVIDTGVGLSPQADDALAIPGRGFGVNQVRERIATSYGGQGSFDLSAAPAGGACVTLNLPLAPTD
jgi:signal transduction histidine kinase